MNNPITPIRLNPQDKAALVELSARLRRGQSDTIRFLVRESLAALKKMDQMKAPASQYPSRRESQMSDAAVTTVTAKDSKANTERE